MRKVTASIGAAMLCFGLAGTAAAATYSFNYPDYSHVPLTIAEGNWFDVVIDDVDIPGTITDVNVFVDITHTSIGDLDIYIGHQQAGGSSYKWVQLYVVGDDSELKNDMTAVTFDDEAATYINDATPPYTPPYGPYSSYKPSANGPDAYGDSNLLSYFDGDLAAGRWTISLFDNFTGDIGTLQNSYVYIGTDAAQSVRVDMVKTPLPGAIVLLGSGLGALAAARRARRK